MVIIGDTILQGGATHIPLSGVTAYHLLEGSLALASTTPTSGFSTTLYTGNGSTQSINTGIDMDTQWGNDVSEKFGGLVWGKSRSLTTDHWLFDSVRGATKGIVSNKTNVEYTDATYLSGFISTGFTGGLGINTNAATYASWNFQTTHRISGTTNHGKAYTCHYNPYTGFTIVRYEGSGLAGHEIPHFLGRKLGFVTAKNLTTSSTQWGCSYTNGVHLNFLTSAQFSDSNSPIALGQDSYIASASGVNDNVSGNSYILYGWANSYFDSANTLIGNYEIGVYQGTGVSGNKVKTRGKPAWVMTKRLDSTSNWTILDNQRLSSNIEGRLYVNVSEAEGTGADMITWDTNGFTIVNTGNDLNTSGGQYLYMVVYDNDSGSGKSKYPKPADAPVINLTAKVPFANGVDVNGTKLSILNKNESISGVTLSQGKNYVYCDNTGAYGKSIHRPRYLSSDLVRTYAGEQPDYFDVNTNKWYSCDAGSELVTNDFVNITASSFTIVEDLITVVGGTTNYPKIAESLTVSPNKKYKVYCYVVGGGDANSIQIYDNSSFNTLYYTNLAITAGTIIDIEIVPITNTLYIMLGNHSTTDNQTVKFSGLTVFQTEITPTTEITNSRNYLDAIVYGDTSGNAEYIEQLPKTQYVDQIKANKYLGKNACTAWVNFDGTTTPPTIRDSFNVSSVVRTATGTFDVYFATPMDNDSYVCSGSNSAFGRIVSNGTKSINKTVIYTCDYNGGNANIDGTQVMFFGGKN